MTVSVEQLNNFFRKTYNDGTLTDTRNWAEGYQSGTLDIILQKAQRNKSVRENKIFDYIAVEGDPNFARNSAKMREKFEKEISALSTATSVVTVINAKLQMAGLTKFVPTNLNKLLLNFQMIADTSINYFTNIQQLVTFKQIEEVLFSDLSFNFYGNVITFNDIALFYSKLQDALSLQDNIENNGLRAILSLGIQDLLPTSMLSIFEAVQYADLLDTIFSSDTDKKSFTNTVSNTIGLYGDSKINTQINTTTYENSLITLDDPLGISIKSDFVNDIEQSYHSEIENAVNDAVSAYSLTPSEIAQIIDLLQTDASSNISTGLANNSIGLPSLATVVKGVNNQTHNNTVNSINTAVDKFIRQIITQIGIKQPVSGSNSVDYLINVKRNLKARKDISTRGVSFTDLDTVDNYIKSVTIDGKVSASIADDLYTEILNYIPDEVVIYG